jgi:hypothetical protein
MDEASDRIGNRRKVRFGQIDEDEGSTLAWLDRPEFRLSPQRTAVRRPVPSISRAAS